MSHRPVFCVVGAGHGGFAMAGCLSLRGFEVRLLNRSPDRLQPVLERGGIEVCGLAVCGVAVCGERTGFTPIALATTDPALALRDADIVLVVVPAGGHRTVARLCAPHLEPGQLVVLHPGRTLGAVEFAQTLRGCGAPAVTVAEAQTFLYASRVCGPARVRIFGVKKAVPVAALEPQKSAGAIRALRTAISQFVPESSVLKTSLDNVGAILHPAMVLLNAGWIEDPAGFEFYRQGASATVARLLEQLDAERLAVAAAIGVEARSARDWLRVVYGAGGATLQAAIQGNASYRGIAAPPETTMRYVTEDVPYSLVPMSSLGRCFGVPTPAMDSLITLASTVHARDYRAEGRTLGALGLTRADLRRLLPRPPGAERLRHRLRRLVQIPARARAAC